MSLRIKGGRVIDPVSGTDKIADIYVSGGKIVPAAIMKDRKFDTIEARGKWVVPGLIDMHVHLREPGQEYKEDIRSGCEAAAAGGFTGIVCMPNTKPVVDCRAVVENILRRASEANGVHVYPTGAITKGMNGEELSEMGDMLAAGAVAFTDDGRCLMNANVLRGALEYARNFDALVMQHGEDMNLSAGGQIFEGLYSTKHGMAGIPAVAESSIVARDVQLCEFTGSRYHAQHVSVKESVEAIRQARRRGVRVTAEVTPHHFTLSDAAMTDYDTNYKMKPPLVSDEHIRALKKGLKDGTIDCIATDHAPHAEIDKLVEFDQASFGIIGLQTALPLSLALVREGVLEPAQLIEKMSVNPARILGIPGGSLAIDEPADITIIDPDIEWEFTAEEILSKSRNTPFVGWHFTGRAEMTIIDGKIVYKR